MSRQVLIVGGAGEGTPGLETMLQRLGFPETHRAAGVDEVLATLAQGDTDLLLLPIDEIDDVQLGAIERASRREGFTGLVATAPRQDPALMLRAMRAGIQEFLVRPIVPSELSGAVERLFRRADGTAVNGPVIAVFGSKGGVGTTTVAVNLAHALARTHAEARVAVADFAIPAGDLRLLLNIRPAYDLGDIAGKIDRLDADVLLSVMVSASERLWALASPEGPEAEELVDANVTTAVVRELRAANGFTVLDCEHQLKDRTLAALDAADRIVLLTELKVPALRSAQRTLGVFRRLGYPDEKVLVVVNRFQSEDVVTPSEATDVLKTPIFFRLPNDYRTCLSASNTGKPIGDSHPESRLAAAYLQMARKISGVEDSVISLNGNGSRGRLRTLFSRRRG